MKNNPGVALPRIRRRVQRLLQRIVRPEQLRVLVGGQGGKHLLELSERFVAPMFTMRQVRGEDAGSQPVFRYLTA